jgi:hypothetical protein
MIQRISAFCQRDTLAPGKLFMMPVKGGLQRVDATVRTLGPFGSAGYHVATACPLAVEACALLSECLSEIAGATLQLSSSLAMVALLTTPTVGAAQYALKSGDCGPA